MKKNQGFLFFHFAECFKNVAEYIVYWVSLVT